MMNYAEALAYLYSLSDFERGGTFSAQPEENLLRETYLLERLGNPQHDYSCTLIAGTKGKGSTAAMMERVLREAGARTGLYTQPDLHTFRERIRVDGRLISEDEVAELMAEMRPVVEGIEAEGIFSRFITYEVATALALLYFARQHVEHAVLEVGLGGRLDATNVTQPLVSVITSISYDHMQILGNTLAEIATEKAGIVKVGGVVVTSAQAPAALLAIADVCRKRRARLVRVGSGMMADPAQAEVEAGVVSPWLYTYQAGQHAAQGQRFSITAPEGVYADLEIALAGRHQLENATAAVAALEQLRARGIEWDETALRAGLRDVRWPARLEVIGNAPTMVVDGAHNADSMERLVEALYAMQATCNWRRWIVVLSVARDKDLPGIVRALANMDAVVLTEMKNARAAKIVQLRELFMRFAPGAQIYAAATTAEAMDLALELADEMDLVCATGSLYLAAEALRWSAGHGNEAVARTIVGLDD